jgi:3-oxoacyl-[acyl-carrier-protein] synthase II
MSLGEGAGFVVLEREDDARRRGATPRIVLSGFGAAADAYHASAPEPNGDGMARAVEHAIHDAGLSPDDIEHYDAHGTGTDANDAAESRALSRIFGSRALSVSATKSFFGHALGAAGILEIAALMLAMERDQRPPTVGFSAARALCPAGLVMQRPLDARTTHAVAHNAAFGGNYAALVLSRPDAPSGRPSLDGEVAVIGWGALVAPGTVELAAMMQQRAPSDDTCLSADGLSDALRGLDLRGADRLSRMLLAGARRALDHADLSVRQSDTDARSVSSERIGLLVGANHLSAESADTFWRLSFERGFDRAPAPAFSRIVMNAPAGVVSRALALRGPQSVVAEGDGAGLRAALLAHLMLKQHADVDVMLVCSAYEIGQAVVDELGDGARPALGETTSCVVLARRDWAIARALSVRALLSSAQSTGARQLPPCAGADAIFVARPATHFGDLPICDVSAHVGAGEATDTLALALAADAVESGAGSALAFAANPRSGSTTVRLRSP